MPPLSANQNPGSTIDLFLTSLSEEVGERAFSVILSGKGGEGAFGMRAIRNNGGTAIAQDPDTAKCVSMPESSIELGVVDRILPASCIAKEVVSLAVNKRYQN